LGFGLEIGSCFGKTGETIVELVDSLEKRHVVIVGQGYVGLPVAMASVDAGYTATGIDSDIRKVGFLAKGQSQVEDVSDEEIIAGLKRGRYHPTDDYSQALGFSVAVITVPTPLKEGAPDLSFIEAAASALSPWVTAGSTVILESTTYPGTTDELLVPILEKGSGLVAGTDFFVGYSPERIDPGNKEWNLISTPKVVSGINAQSLEKVQQFYESLGIQTVPVSGTREAEMAKLLENTFRHVNIALVNELAMFSDQLGVNIREAIDAASTKPFGFMKFSPGPGVGGHCLPIDPSYLSWAIKDKSGAEFKFVSLANDVNDLMPQFVVDRALRILERSGTPMSGASVLIIGLAYKPDTGDTRESPAAAVSQLLEARGAHLYAIDDHVPPHSWPGHITRANDAEHRDFDLAILITNHRGANHEWAVGSSRIVLDTRNCLVGENVEQM
jgi:nucleotide sugar dehydrogenase